MYTDLIKGNWSVLLKESIPFWERAYFMVVLYGILEDDPLKGKTLIEMTLNKNELPISRHWELLAMDLPFFQMWCGNYKKATNDLSWAYDKVIEHKLDGFKLAILIQQIFPLWMTHSRESATKRMNEAERLLQEKPYLRELSYFNLSKGLCSITNNDEKNGKKYIEYGMKIMKQAKFELQYLHALTHLTHSLKQLLGTNHSLFLYYHKRRNELIRNSHEIKNSLLKEIKIFL
jgi:hypothetical protein